MYLLKKGIQVAGTLQAMVEVIQVEGEVLTKEEAINIQAQAIITAGIRIRVHDRNTAANIIGPSAPVGTYNFLEPDSF